MERIREGKPLGEGEKGDEGMKIGIVTVHDSSNVGSYLQALGMQELVLQRGDEPVFIETRSHFSTFCLFMGYNNARTARSFKSAVYFLLQALRHPGEMRKRREKYARYRRDWGRFRKVVSVKEANRMGLDCVLLGSDEIWNANQPAFQNPLFYGVGIRARRKLGYAVSVGNLTAERLARYPALEKGIQELDGILPRDERTISLLRERGFSVEARICDPTLQVEPERLRTEATDVRLEKGYVVVYGYHVDGKYREWIQTFARQKGLRTVAVSLPLDWCDEYANCSPLEFGAILKQADYVFTSTFHGTIFSALQHARFVSLGAQPKVADVLELLELRERLLPEDCDYETFASLLEREEDWERLEQRLSRLRQESRMLYERWVQGGETVEDL